MHFDVSLDINAPREYIWSVLQDVERWPEWTPSMRRVQYIQGSSLAVGSRVRIQQPRMPALVWEVTGVEQKASFFWRTTSPGVITEAGHRLLPGPSGTTTVILSVRQYGPLAWLIGLLTASTTRRYVQQEANGLKQRCQAAAPQS